MTLYFEEEGELTLPLSCREVAEEVIETALDMAGCPYEAEVSLLLTMDVQIREMNTQFRGIERATGYVVKVFNLVNPENSDSWKRMRDILIRNQASCLWEILSFPRKK